MPTALNDLLPSPSRPDAKPALQERRPCAIIFEAMEQPDFSSSPWCAFAPGKEAWKRDGNFFTSEELRQIDNADDLAIYQPLDPVLSAD
jgi:hypothetical protein